MISDEFWKRRFNADPENLGKKTISVERLTYEIVGVLAARAPLAVLDSPSFGADHDPTRERHWPRTSVVARIPNGRAPQTGVAPEQASAPRGSGAPRSTRRIPTLVMVRRDRHRRSRFDADRVSPVVRRSLFVLFGAVGLVLLIACVNLANLPFAAPSRRQQVSGLRCVDVRPVRMPTTERVLLAATAAPRASSRSRQPAHESARSPRRTRPKHCAYKIFRVLA